MTRHAGKIALLADDPEWVKPLLDALTGRGAPVELVDLRQFQWLPSEPLPKWDLVVNRISARPPVSTQGLLTKARDLLTCVEMAGIPCINNIRCLNFGASKALQAALFQACGYNTPETIMLTEEELTVGVWPKSDSLLKPNAGGRGSGIVDGQGSLAETFAADGCAVRQERIESHDNLIHRVELLAGELLYHAGAPLRPGTFDYCLGGGREIQIDPACPPEIALSCRRIARNANMEIGSVEYLIDADHTLWFIDLNPVSSIHPKAAQELEFDPVERIADYIFNKNRRALTGALPSLRHSQAERSRTRHGDGRE